MAKPGKRRKRIWLSVVAVIIVAMIASAAFRKKDSAVVVQTEKVVRRDVIEIVMANGKIQPVRQVIISPEVAGEIVELPVKEGDRVSKGDLLVQIKPDNYIASRNSAEAHYKSAIASRELAKAQLDKAEAEYRRHQELAAAKLVSDSVFLDVKTTYEVARLQYQNALHQEDQAKFGLDKANDDLSKTRIVSPMDGTVTRLNSELGERVLGTSFNKGTEIMTIADLREMEARVEVGETDVVLIRTGQKARLDVDAFKDRTFTGVVTEIANSARTAGGTTLGAASGQEATRFEVRIRVAETELLRPGMSVTAEIETRIATNALTVPFMSVTTRRPEAAGAGGETNSPARSGGPKDGGKPIEVVFVVEGDRVKMVPVKLGISDSSYYEIIEGLEEGQEVVSGSYSAIRELEDGKKIVRERKGAEPERVRL
ncbi:MAG TPA: efflux RND transporter periplasmic adaptor subunit [Verrucomicrobia bacterium]|nr:efflux RND transporter periplasmic adaptor subunit [Verrucomicrobiota bacterium]HOP96291.1 efflux RND transporter periplasmic adaptor subunit [Verrucomicrobiota bacterium]HPU55375.1 efflux RND transporter periplasmic adaptor subunit [Verrucomicrobiota bacterium]